ncbi:MAG: hypothetical protein HY017_14580 [Betaproteobacteria bacterium]|nr:hypothetical protein [Betaproteobacteria bacterium]
MPTETRRADISDGTLRRLMASAVLAMAAWFALRHWLPPAWREPGSPELYLTGVAGALLLLVPIAFALAKRSGRSRAPLAWFNAHVLCSSLGAVLIVIHSGGFLRRAPALLLLAIVALAALGVWARLHGSRRMAATFASKQPTFALPDAGTREQLRQLIAQKRALLRDLDPAANEGTFSVTLSHILRRPGLAFAYQKLARAEAELLGTRQAVGAAQSGWRPLHMAIAWTFVFGVLVHVVTVTFFAGYVAGGGTITWWHLAAW